MKCIYELRCYGIKYECINYILCLLQLGVGNAGTGGYMNSNHRIIFVYDRFYWIYYEREKIIYFLPRDSYLKNNPRASL